jgi:hypothetical protein
MKETQKKLGLVAVRQLLSPSSTPKCSREDTRVVIPFLLQVANPKQIPKRTLLLLPLLSNKKAELRDAQF